jgi:hypothetical protein
MYPQDEKIEKVPQREITSLDIVSFDGGRDERHPQSADPNTFSSSRNMVVTSQGLLTHRYSLKRWLPDLVETVYQIYPVLYDGTTYYITADDGKIKYIETGDSAWTDCGGTNSFTTGTGTITTFLRIQDKVLILNGVEKLAYVDLTNFEVVKFTPVTDPTNAPTVTATGITTTGVPKIYYAVTFNSTVGETALGPILTSSVSKERTTWKEDGTEFLTVARNNTAPAGAVSWNLYVSLAPAGASIQPTDMLPLGVGIDLSVTTFVDNGTIPILLSRGTAPQDNSTDGPAAKFGIETNGRPILWGDEADPYTLWIGGDGEYPLDFTPTNGGYRLELNKGTNYYPMSVVGFRNGQGTPSLTVLFSNTQGLSKQSIIEQQTVTFGNFSFVVWTTTEQNYGASGVAGAYAVTNYQGALIFLSSDGGMSMDTQASLQNVLSTRKITDKIPLTYNSINPALLGNAVGCAWDNIVYFSIPSRGFAYNNEIIMYDVENKDKPKWYSMDIRAQWIGVVSPGDRRGFVYICQDNHVFRLQEGFVAVDDDPNGTLQAFPVEARGSFAGLNKAHNNYTAIVQAMFYFLDAVGTVNIGVSYRNGNDIETVEISVDLGEYIVSPSGGWSDPQYLYQIGYSTYNEWDDIAVLSDATGGTKQDIRVPLPLGGIITNEMQWWVYSDLINTSFTLHSVSYEGVNIGIKGDLV